MLSNDSPRSSTTRAIVRRTWSGRSRIAGGAGVPRTAGVEGLGAIGAGVGAAIEM